MNDTKKFFVTFFLYFGLSCSAQIDDINDTFHYAGRVELQENNKVLLIASASSVSFDFEGSTCVINLQSVDTYEHHNFVSLELDGEYIGRVLIKKGVAQKNSCNYYKQK